MEHQLSRDTFVFPRIETRMKFGGCVVRGQATAWIKAEGHQMAAVTRAAETQPACSVLQETTPVDLHGFTSKILLLKKIFFGNKPN